MRDSKGAFDKDSRCDASPVFCIVAAEQATRSGAFEGFFGQAFHRAAFPNAPFLFSLSWAAAPSNSPAGAPFRYSMSSRNNQQVS